MSKIDNFPYTTPILEVISYFGGDPFGALGLGSAESEVPKLVIREIILEEFQRV